RIEEHHQALRHRRGLRGGLARRERLEERQADGDAAEAPKEMAALDGLHRESSSVMSVACRRAVHERTRSGEIDDEVGDLVAVAAEVLREHPDGAHVPG